MLTFFSDLYDALFGVRRRYELVSIEDFGMFDVCVVYECNGERRTQIYGVTTQTGCMPIDLIEHLNHWWERHLDSKHGEGN